MAVAAPPLAVTTAAPLRSQIGARRERVVSARKSLSPNKKWNLSDLEIFTRNPRQLIVYLVWFQKIGAPIAPASGAACRVVRRNSATGARIFAPTAMLGWIV
jgi:hypothetical protein